jgi:tetratricopeptide (TPR) repeat protein
VAYVLEGSVQRAGDDVRITTQLIDARTGYHLWSEKYDRKLTSVFAIEDEISKAIADQMQVTLGNKREEPLVKIATADPQAHEFYLKGLARMTERGPGLTNAVEFFKKAIELDSNYAAAWAGLGQACELLPWYKLAPWPTSLNQAQQAAERALALDSQLAEAHTALANVLRDRMNFADATKEYQAALERNPGSVETLNQYAQMLLRMGQFEEAAKQERTAVALDPLAPNPRYILALVLGDLHRYDEAIAEEKVVIARSPNYTYARFDLAYLYLYVSKYAEAEKEARAAAAQVGEDPEAIAALVRGVANPAQRAAALRLVTEGKIGRYALRGMTDAFWYSMLGEHEKALESLTKWLATTQEGQLFSDTPALWKPAFDPIRGDERFEKIMKSAGLPAAVVHPEYSR